MKDNFFNKTPHIIVIGDCMLDEYIDGEVTRISPEAPVPILNMKRTRTSLGGAANVAHNLVTMGCKVTLLSPLSTDNKLIHELERAGINYDSLNVTSRPTTIKTRYYSGGHYMFRVDNEIVDEYHDHTYRVLLDSLEHILSEDKEIKVIVLSDYAKGVFSRSFTQDLKDIANKYNVKTLVDAKPQNFNLFKGVTLLKPNVKEAQTYYHQSKIRKDEIGINLVKDLDLEATLITAASDGMCFVNKKSNIEIPAITMEIVDTCGAGDSVLAAIAKCYATDIGVNDMLEIAQIVGHLSCTHLGVVAVRLKEINDKL